MCLAFPFLSSSLSYRKIWWVASRIGGQWPSFSKGRKIPGMLLKASRDSEKDADSVMTGFGLAAIGDFPG